MVILGKKPDDGCMFVFVAIMSCNGNCVLSLLAACTRVKVTYSGCGIAGSTQRKRT